MSGLRSRIAQRLVEVQQTAAILTTFNEVDMSRVMDLRTAYKEPFQKKHGVGLGFMSFFVKASVDALKAFPAVNARIDGNEIVYHNFYDIGVAVSTERGLMVPVIRDAEQLSFAAIEKAIAGFATKARDGTISVDDLQGGTFTITNGGHLRLAALDPDPEPAPERHPGHARHQEAARRCRRSDRDPIR